MLKQDGFSPVFVDFSQSAWKKRHAEGKKQGLVRACQPAQGTHIIDATAGWGRDAAVLASFGAQVLMLERNPTMAALLEDALHRDPTMKLGLTLIMTDAQSYLSALTSTKYPDVVYIDPMHPIRQKSALVKKDMQLLQHLVKPDEDTADLIQLAITRTQKRVVVKWPQHEKPSYPPDFSLPGKTVRFDVYLSR
ncbi:MAG: class I SAM-dependent methyltransferase [Legionellaceae bacterium]